MVDIAAEVMHGLTTLSRNDLAVNRRYHVDDGIGSIAQGVGVSKVMIKFHESLFLNNNLRKVSDAPKQFIYVCQKAKAIGTQLFVIDHHHYFIKI